MEEKEKDEILTLYTESIAEAPTKALPDYLIFAEKIIIREVNRAAKAVCFLCNEGNNPTQSVSGQWTHQFHRDSGFTYIESCRAHVVRMRKIPV